MYPVSVILKTFVVFASLSAARPSSWSVPPGKFEWRLVDAFILIKPLEHLEILALRRATPLNPDSVSDVRCWNTEE